MTLPALKDWAVKVSSIQTPVVEVIKCHTKRVISSDFISSFLEHPEVTQIYGDGFFRFFGHHDLSESSRANLPTSLLQRLGKQDGDINLLHIRPSGKHAGGSRLIGKLRTLLYEHLVKVGDTPAASGYQFLWVEDFPMFSPNEEGEPGQGGSSGFRATHHPFTAPKSAEDFDVLLTDPLEAKAAHYDIVVNGVELGGGSRRIHNAAIQEYIFRDILKMPEHRIEDFRPLLNALGAGCPPHAGIALGFDRLIAVMLGKTSVRDVIAFPKNNQGEDPLVDSPNLVTAGQLSTYHLHLKP